MYLYPLSYTTYDDEGNRSNASFTLAVAVNESTTPTVAARYGDKNLYVIHKDQ